MRIIPLGEGCQITWDLQALELRGGSTGLFEWFTSTDMSDINRLLRKLAAGEELRVTSRENFPHDVFMDDTQIRSCHYTPDEYALILPRRVERFVDTVRDTAGGPLVFIRYDHQSRATTGDDLAEFRDCIRAINPECVFEIFVFFRVNDTSGTQHPDGSAFVIREPADLWNALAQWAFS